MAFYFFMCPTSCTFQLLLDAFKYKKCNFSLPEVGYNVYNNFVCFVLTLCPL